MRLPKTMREAQRCDMRFETVLPNAASNCSRLRVQMYLRLFYFDFAAFSSSKTICTLVFSRSGIGAA